MKNDASSLEYRVKLYNDFSEPYTYNDSNDDVVRHKTYDEYAAYDEKTFYKILDDFLDAPKKSLSEKDVRKDFDTKSRKISDASMQAIMTYYNGRYKLSKYIYSKLKKTKFDSISVDLPVVMKFKIPFCMNYFSTEDNSAYDKNIRMNDAYISIEISRIS